MGLEEKFGYCLNLVIFLMSTAVLIYASVSIYDFEESGEDEGLYSKDDYVWILLAGLFGIFLSLFACFAIQNQQRNYNMLFIYFIGLSVILCLNVAGLYFYVTFTSALDFTEDGNVEAAVKTEIAQELEDYILSTYTTCCTGCPTSEVSECQASFPNPSTKFCNNTSANISLVESSDCLLATICTGSSVDKLGSGCYLNAKGEIPSYAVSQSTCSFLEGAQTSDDKPSVVGPVSDGSCGNGNPSAYVEDLKEYLLANRNSIIAVLSITIIVVGLTWLGTFKMLLCPERRDRNTLVGHH